MTLHVVGSSSKGNAYILEGRETALLLECGEPLREVKKALHFNISKVRACLMTHEHGDHAKHLKEYIRDRIPVYCTNGTAKAATERLLLGSSDIRGVRVIEYGKQVRIEGGWSVIPFETRHDAYEPCGFLIHHKEMGTALFATDTYYIRNRFKGLNHVLIECNYSDSMAAENIELGTLDAFHYRRLRKSHLSYENCKRFLLSNDLTRVHNIVLIHLSETNADAKAFQRGIEEATGKAVSIAKRGLSIDFSPTPF